jgi:hypothetical protein
VAFPGARRPHAAHSENDQAAHRPIDRHRGPVAAAVPPCLLGVLGELALEPDMLRLPSAMRNSARS